MTISHHVAVNLLSVVPGRVGGAEEYATRTLQAFAKHGPADLHPVLYTVESFVEMHPDLGKLFDIVVCPIQGAVRSRRILFESTWLARKTRNASATHHFGGRLPLNISRPAAVTVHDLQPLDHPQNFSALKAAYLSWAIPRSVKRADLIVAVSDQVAQRLRQYFPIDPAKVKTVFSGVEQVVTDPANPASTPIILYPAATYPHKNHLTLIRAFEQVADAHSEIQLVLTGGAGRAETEVVEAIEKSRHRGRIKRTGRISQEELNDLMKNSTVVAFPSKYEGFGLPVLEAMAAGVPAIVGAGTPPAEILDDSEWTVAPEDISGWTSAITRAVSDPNERFRAARKAIDRANEYKWEHSAAQLEKVWRQLLSRNSQ